MASNPATAAAVRKIYREFIHFGKHQNWTASQYNELRTQFRQPTSSSSPSASLEQLLQSAESRLSFLRMNARSPPRPRGKLASNSQRWIYKDGEKYENVNGTIRGAKGRVHTNWDGKNLDPESVKRHRQQLKRCGFVNNAHAKGIF